MFELSQTELIADFYIFDEFVVNALKTAIFGIRYRKTSCLISSSLRRSLDIGSPMHRQWMSLLTPMPGLDGF